MKKSTITSIFIIALVLNAVLVNAQKVDDKTFYGNWNGKSFLENGKSNKTKESFFAKTCGLVIDKDGKGTVKAMFDQPMVWKFDTNTNQLIVTTQSIQKGNDVLKANTYTYKVVKATDEELWLELLTASVNNNKTEYHYQRNSTSME